MKFRLLCSAMLLAGLMSSFASAAPLPLVNADFEDPALAPLTDTYGAVGWTAFNGAYTRYQSPHTGNQALKAFGGGGVFQDFSATPGVRYDAAVYGLNPSFDALTGDAIGAVNLEFRDAGNNLIGDILTNPFLNSSSPQGDSEGGNFPEVYILGEVSAIAPPNTASVRIALYSGGGGGAAYFDDASLTASVAIPEPGSLAALAIGSTVMVLRRRRRR